MAESSILILTAVEIEARAIARALGLKPTRASDVGLRSWSDVQHPIHLHPIGIGAKYLPQIPAKGNRCIILAGFAGALDPSLKIGDIVLDDCPAAWKKTFAGRCRSIHCSKEMISTAALKNSLYEQTCAAAVDMESDAVRHWAKAAGAPFISIRAISDTADEDLNPALLRFVDDIGGVKPLALSRELLRNPMLLAQLLRLRNASQRAGDSLGKAVRQLAEQIEKTPVAQDDCADEMG